MFNVVAIGDILIDFTPCGKSESGNVIFERNPGGATANTLVAMSNLGDNTAFIGKVGKDSFGTFLREVLEEHGVDTTGLVETAQSNTTLAFVHLDKQGDRSFSFYRDPGADMMLTKEEIRFKAIENCEMFYFSSIVLSKNPAREALFEGLRFAKKNCKLISHDVNLRPLLWNNLDEAKQVILEGLAYVDILKVSDEELQFLTDTEDKVQGAKFFINNYGISVVFVTSGPKGCHYFTEKINGSVPAYKVNTVDTTGAGDAFMGAALHKILKIGKEISNLTQSDLKMIADFACAAGSFATQKRGAIPAMPSLEEIEALMELNIRL